MSVFWSRFWFITSSFLLLFGVVKDHGLVAGCAGLSVGANVAAWLMTEKNTTATREDS